MKKITFLIALALLFIKCSEDEINSTTIFYRLKEYKEYEGGTLDYKVNLTYVGEQLTRWDETDVKSGNIDFTAFEYDGNMVTAFDYWSDVVHDKTTYLIENGLTKEVNGYNKLGEVNWELSWRETYQYSDSKISIISYEDYWDDNVWKHKNEFLYEADNHVGTIKYDWSDGNWVMDSKSEFQYTDNKLSAAFEYGYNKNSATWENNRKVEHSYEGELLTQITAYKWDVAANDWKVDDTMTIDYDSNGNISEINYGDWSEEFVYELGKGNLKNFALYDADYSYYNLDLYKSGSTYKEYLLQRRKFPLTLSRIVDPLARKVRNL